MLRQQARPPQVKVAYLSKTCPILNTAGRTVMNRKKKNQQKESVLLFETCGLRHCDRQEALSDRASIKMESRLSAPRLSCQPRGAIISAPFLSLISGR
ncbi:hypothetical protein CEXT_569601 [Caerostris extrusa]|uniref:Uncharacterized protein n=1 Tax=Caerostris extrusa TaxID=172846 RepID=A0AAV4RJF1_CAEEX|nr:hypothetical protein CEXT_569601 [Caerostris extrusa]